MKSVIDYLSGYFKGKAEGESRILKDIAKICKANEYPEDLEMAIYDYLQEQGVDV